MNEKTREILVSMNHQQYLDYLNSSELIDKLIEEVARLKGERTKTIVVNGYIEIAGESDLLDNLEFNISGELDFALVSITQTFRSEARIERFSNNIGEIKKLEKEKEELQKKLFLIPGWIRSIFVK